VKTLNEVYSSRSVSRRYEVWFLRMGLADGSGAWWFRYLLMNPGRNGCPGNPAGMPVQVWATWFPRDAKPQSFIQGFPLENLELSPRGQNPFHFRVGNNQIEQNACRGALEVDGHKISWDMEYRSTFRVTLSNKGWIGFSRTPHSNARFSGKITLDGRTFEGNPIAFGVQGHNCGYRHRGFWNWAHAYFARTDGSPTTVEALVYDMPFGMVFRKVALWHEGQRYLFQNLQDIKKDQKDFQWIFRCGASNGLQLQLELDGCGQSIHRLPYVRTDCSGSFEVVNNSLAKAKLRLQYPGKAAEELATDNGAVLEMTGQE
jgi:hypothetical protein